MNDEQLRSRARDLHLHGLVAHWPEVATADWVPQLVGWEEEERTRRSLERRLKDARIGRFKPLADFDWKWPARCDRGAIAVCGRDYRNDLAGDLPVRVSVEHYGG